MPRGAAHQPQASSTMLVESTSVPSISNRTALQRTLTKASIASMIAPVTSLVSADRGGLTGDPDVILVVSCSVDVRWGFRKARFRSGTGRHLPGTEHFSGTATVAGLLPDYRQIRLVVQFHGSSVLLKQSV